MLKDLNRIDLKSNLNMLYMQTGITYSCPSLNIFEYSTISEVTMLTIPLERVII